jgi:hypothetical protein
MSDERPLDRARFLRHLVLAEIGESGQRRLSHASCEVPTGTASDLEIEVAHRYLAGAGVGSVHTSAASSIEAPSWVLARAARDVLQGSLAALREIRSALDATASGLSDTSKPTPPTP